MAFIQMEERNLPLGTYHSRSMGALQSYLFTFDRRHLKVFGLPEIVYHIFIEDMHSVSNMRADESNRCLLFFLNLKIPFSFYFPREEKIFVF